MQSLLVVEEDDNIPGSTLLTSRNSRNSAFDFWRRLIDYCNNVMYWTHDRELKAVHGSRGAFSFFLQIKSFEIKNVKGNQTRSACALLSPRPSFGARQLEDLTQKGQSCFHQLGVNLQ